MSTKITPLPGVHCLHYLQGHCLLEERRNPGLHLQWRCQVLREWERAYDKFLAQAENFQLELGLATRIWGERLGGMLQQPAPCEHYLPTPEQLPGEDEDVLHCLHSWAGLCILSLPDCGGVCDKFLHKPRAEAS